MCLLYFTILFFVKVLCCKFLGQPSALAKFFCQASVDHYFLEKKSLNTKRVFSESRLSSQDAFFSKLSDSPCSDTEYAHATQVWTVYLKCDVQLLTDYIEKFHATCLAHYSLDAVHYYTVPGLAWYAALRMSHLSLELITDVDMYHFLENSIRGGVAMITTRYGRANSPTLPAYDASL